jgi:hypothetical protein
VDDNASKDLSGRIAVSPVHTPGLRIVINGARGEQPGGLRTRAGLGVDYRRGAWHLLVEGLRQGRDNLPVSHGYVAMVAYGYRPKVPRSIFAQVEFAARVWILHDRAAAAGASSDIINDDDGGGGESRAEAGMPPRASSRPACVTPSRRTSGSWATSLRRSTIGSRPDRARSCGGSSSSE